MSLTALSFIVSAVVAFPDVILGELGTRFLSRLNFKFKSWITGVVFATDELFLPESQWHLNCVSLGLLALCALLVAIESPSGAGLFSALILGFFVMWRPLRNMWFKRGSKIWLQITGHMVGRKKKVVERIE
jgi:membrane protein implicated in regulation of membrane protease activity